MSQLSNYLTSSIIPADSHLVRIGIGVSIGLVVLGLVLWLVSLRFRRTTWGVLLQRVSPILGAVGLGWLLLFLLRFQSLYPFNRRIWVYVWAILALGWFAYRLWTFCSVVPAKRHENIRYQKYDKYLPKPKKS